MTMKNLTLTIGLAFAILLGSSATSWGADYSKAIEAHERGDFVTALREYELLAERGHSEAMTRLGYMHFEGQGVIQHYGTARKWWVLAAEMRHPEAMFHLGYMYASGKGVPQDPVYSHMWWNISASLGYEHARDVRDVFAEVMTTFQIEKAQELAQECVRKEYKGC